jgi:hypothetical protein
MHSLHRWQCRWSPGLWISEEANGELSSLRWYVSDLLFPHHYNYFLLQVISNLWNFTTSTLIGIHLGVLICALSLLITISILWGADDLIYIFFRGGMVKEVKGTVCRLECKTRNWKKHSTLLGGLVHQGGPTILWELLIQELGAGDSCL